MATPSTSITRTTEQATKALHTEHATEQRGHARATSSAAEPEARHPASGDSASTGLLYVSAQFSTAAHLCACGCGREVITPISPAQWVLIFDGTVSMTPSIGNWVLPCQSHYVIDHGTIRWARGFTRDEIERNRESDHQILDGVHAAQEGWWRRLLRHAKRRER